MSCWRSAWTTWQGASAPMERLTPLSAGFLQVEDEDTTATLAIASIAVFEGPAPSHEEFVAHITGRLPLVARFRQRVRQVPFDLAAPVWADDPAVDVGWHVRRTALPSPGGPDELHSLVARVMAQRMDRNRPLWEYWVVEGLRGRPVGGDPEGASLRRGWGLRHGALPHRLRRGPGSTSDGARRLGAAAIAKGTRAGGRSRSRPRPQARCSGCAPPDRCCRRRALWPGSS